ncbi:MAG: sigma-70 family RNA polymerase sigma factor [Chitinophagaceae bacterium]
MNLISNQNINESDLITGCLNGDSRMQEELYKRFAPKMYSVCLRYANNVENAQDLLQEGFIKIFRNLDRFRGDGSFEGWVRRIFINTSIEYYRKKANVFFASEKEELMVEDSSLNALDKLAEKDIIKLVQELSPGYRTVFNLYAIEGYSHKEIGIMLNISEGTSKSQLARAKGILKNKVDRFLDEKRKSLIRK